MQYKEEVLSELRKQNIIISNEVLEKLKIAKTEVEITRVLLENELFLVFVRALKNKASEIQEYLNKFWKDDFDLLYKEVLTKCIVFTDFYFKRLIEEGMYCPESVLYSLLSLIVEGSIIEAKIKKMEHKKILEKVNMYVQ